MDNLSNVNKHQLRALESNDILDTVFELAFSSGDINLIRFYFALKDENILKLEKIVEQESKTANNEESFEI